MLKVPPIDQQHQHYAVLLTKCRTQDPLKQNLHFNKFSRRLLNARQSGSSPGLCLDGLSLGACRFCSLGVGHPQANYLIFRVLGVFLFSMGISNALGC